MNSPNVIKYISLFGFLPHQHIVSLRYSSQISTYCLETHSSCGEALRIAYGWSSLPGQGTRSSLSLAEHIAGNKQGAGKFHNWTKRAHVNIHQIIVWLKEIKAIKRGADQSEILNTLLPNLWSGALLEIEFLTISYIQPAITIYSQTEDENPFEI